MSSFEKSWVGRFVIGLQLLAWCAVGALLLHRGYTSIKEDVKKPLNSTTAMNSYHQTNLSELIITNSLLDKSTPSDSNPVSKVTGKSNQIGKHSSMDIISSNNNLEKQTGNLNNSLTSVKIAENITESPEHLLNQANTLFNNESSEQISTPLTKSTSPVTHNVRIPPHFQKRKYDLTPSGVVMTAIGAIMLVVGPSLVILRCCDSETNGRRFDKLSADDPSFDLADLDLPPTYEEVSGIAPSYSMIFPVEQEAGCSRDQK